MHLIIRGEGRGRLSGRGLFWGVFFWGGRVSFFWGLFYFFVGVQYFSLQLLYGVVQLESFLCEGITFFPEWGVIHFILFPQGPFYPYSNALKKIPSQKIESSRKKMSPVKKNSTI